MVTFSNQPYHEALNKGQHNTELVQKIIKENLEHKIEERDFMESFLAQRDL
ncbi:MAG: Uncharacterised protein [Bacteroidetes bacterium MED-G17]|nr:MAG: Uncharacterised protein [Bacteroidetes bacterium MED-G17]